MSEGSEISWCASNHSSDSEEELIYENVEPREDQFGRETISEDSIESHSSPSDNFRVLESSSISLTPVNAEMEEFIKEFITFVTKQVSPTSSPAQKTYTVD